MSKIANPHIETLLKDFVSSLKDALSGDLVGVYLYGSQATGDFDENTSDIDLLIVVNDEIDITKQDLLTNLHNDFNNSHKLKSTKLDVAYVTEHALKTFKDKPYEIIVSDGEGGLETHVAPAYYLIDWYKIQEHGIVLYGSDVNEVMPHITLNEFTKTMLDYMHRLQRQIVNKSNRGHLAYIVVTLCRSLYAFKYVKHVSKKLGVDWAIGQYPQWEELIQDAFTWNRNEQMENVDDKAYQEQALAFSRFILSQTENKA